MAEEEKTETSEEVSTEEKEEEKAEEETTSAPSNPIEEARKVRDELRKDIETFKDTPRHKLHICGNCWDWQKYPPQPLDLVGGKI